MKEKVALIRALLACKTIFVFTLNKDDQTPYDIIRTNAFTKGNIEIQSLIKEKIKKSTKKLVEGYVRKCIKTKDISVFSCIATMTIQYFSFFTKNTKYCYNREEDP